MCPPFTVVRTVVKSKPPLPRPTSRSCPITLWDRSVDAIMPRTQWRRECGSAGSVGSAGVLIVDDAHYPPITFSTGHPDGIRQAITSVVRNQYAMNTRDNPSKPLQNTRPNSPHVRCSTAFASSTTLTSSITSTLKISSASQKDNPWDVPFVHVFPLFNRDPLRIPIGGLTRLVTRYRNIVP